MKSRIIAIDYGLKKSGVAVSDVSRSFAFPLKTIDTKDLFVFLKEYFLTEDVGVIVVGNPVVFLKENSIKSDINKFVSELEKVFFDKKIVFCDERYTSKIGRYIIKNSCFKKKERERERVLDKISAAVILQTFLDMKK